MTPQTATPAHEETAGAVGAAAGGQTPQEGIEMNSTIIARDADIHESLRHLVTAGGAFDVHSEFCAPQLLPEGDPRWIDQDSVRREKPDLMGPRFAVLRVWDLRTGEHVFEGSRAPEGWYPEQMGAWYDRLDWFARTMPNTYVVNGDYLFVSGGAWVITGMPNAAGEVEFTSMTSIEARADADDQSQAEWLAAHASKVVSAQPAWAQSEHTEVDFDTEDGHAEAILFSRRVGSVAIEQLFTVDGDSITAADEPHVWEEVDGHSLAADRAAIVGVDMLHAAQILNGGGNIGAGLFDVVGKELGISGADLHALAHVDKDPENDITMGDLFRMARFVGMSPMALYKLGEQHRIAQAEGRLTAEAVSK